MSACAGYGEDEEFSLAAQRPAQPPPEPEPEPLPPPPELPLEPQIDPNPGLTQRRQQLLELLIPPDTEDAISEDEGAAFLWLRCTATLADSCSWSLMHAAQTHPARWPNLTNARTVAARAIHSWLLLYDQRAQKSQSRKNLRTSYSCLVHLCLGQGNTLPAEEQEQVEPESSGDSLLLLGLEATLEHSLHELCLAGGHSDCIDCRRTWLPKSSNCFTSEKSCQQPMLPAEEQDPAEPESNGDLLGLEATQRQQTIRPAPEPLEPVNWDAPLTAPQVLVLPSLSCCNVPARLAMACNVSDLQRSALQLSVACGCTVQAEHAAVQCKLSKRLQVTLYLIPAGVQAPGKEAADSSLQRDAELAAWVQEQSLQLSSAAMLAGDSGAPLLLSLASPTADRHKAAGSCGASSDCLSAHAQTV